ncbi:unnamed protein product [marine sediment metagenome]
MAQPPTTKDQQGFLNALVGLSALAGQSKEETTERTFRRKRRAKKRATSKNEKVFLNALIDFRRHGYSCNCSMNGSWVVLEFYGVSLAFNGFKAAAKALLDLIERWNHE